MIGPEQTYQNDIIEEGHYIENLGRQGTIYRLTADGKNYKSISTEEVEKCEQLGSGSQGDIYKIMIDGIYYALKMIKKGASFQLKEHWNMEIQINKVLSNDINLTNIVRMINSGEDWMLFELMDYTISKYIELTKHKMIKYESQLKPIVQQIIKGLELLHSKNIFHGDLKPQNILVKVNDDDSIIIKLADFGCSRIMQEKPNETTERINKRNNLLKEDMCTLGIIIHELWFGTKPNYKLVQHTAKPTSPQLIDLINNLITDCVEKRMDIKQLQNDEYWKFNLLQPFPAMKIFQGEFKFDIGINDIQAFDISQIIVALKLINSAKVKKLLENPEIINQCKTMFNDIRKNIQKAQSIEEIGPKVKKIKQEYQSFQEK